MKKNKPYISVVIPIYNEEEVLPHLYERMVNVLKQLDKPYEIIFVNDCSNDNSLELLNRFYRENPSIKIVSFSRNFGHQSSITAGLNFSRGDAVIIMDGDLQDPPELIPKFIDKWKEGNAVVYAIRNKRKEFIIKRFAYFTFYRALKLIASIDIPLDSGDFCLMDRKVVDLLNSLPERERFVRGLRSWIGFRQAGLKFERDERFAGKPKYNLIKLLRLALDGIFSFSEVPLKIVMLSGFVVSGTSLLFALYVVFNFMFGTQMYFINRNPGWASLVVSITFLGGIQLISIGILGEYIGRIFSEAKQRPHFVVDELIGFEDIENESS